MKGSTGNLTWGIWENVKCCLIILGERAVGASSFVFSLFWGLNLFLESSWQHVCFDKFSKALRVHGSDYGIC